MDQLEVYTCTGLSQIAKNKTFENERNNKNYDFIVFTNQYLD